MLSNVEQVATITLLNKIGFLVVHKNQIVASHMKTFLHLGSIPLQALQNCKKWYTLVRLNVKSTPNKLDPCYHTFCDQAQVENKCSQVSLLEKQNAHVLLLESTKTSRF